MASIAIGHERQCYPLLAPLEQGGSLPALSDFLGHEQLYLYSEKV